MVEDFSRCDVRTFVGASLNGVLGTDPWTWVTGEPWTWPNGGAFPWEAGEPNSPYLALNQTGLFDGRPGGTALPFICEREP